MGRGAPGKPPHAEMGRRGVGVRGWDPLVGAEDPQGWGCGARTPGRGWDLLSVGLGSPRDWGARLGLVGGAGTLLVWSWDPPQCGTGVSCAGGEWLGDSPDVGEGSPHYGAETTQCAAVRPRSGNGTPQGRSLGLIPAPPAWELVGPGMWMGLPRDRDAEVEPLSVGLGSLRDWG